MSCDQHNYSSPVSAGRHFYRVVLLVVLLAAAVVVIWYLNR
jgi:hypothetical protein